MLRLNAVGRYFLFLAATLCCCAPALAQAPSDDTKINLSYTAKTKAGLTLSGNYNALSNSFETPLTWHYRGDWGLSLNKTSKVSFFAEGAANQNSLTLLSPSYDQNRSWGMGYSLARGSTSVSLQYQAIYASPAAALQTTNKTLSVSITSNL